MSFSVNNKLILEPYTGSREIKQQVVSGFSHTKQKTSIVGLKLLEDAKVVIGKETLELSKGSVVYFQEELLSTNPSYSAVREMDNVKEKFVIGNFHEAVYIK